MELKTLSTPIESGRKSLSDWRALVSRAFGRAQCSQKRIASDLGITEGQLSRQLSGAEHLSFWRMFNLPPEFWQELLPLIADYHGLTLNGSPQERSDAEVGRLMREAIQRVVVAR